MKRVLSLIISFGILALIYSRIDLSRILPVFRDASIPWLIASLGMVLPLTALTAYRLCQLMPGDSRLGFLESNRLILLASVLNLVLPSKMGDVAKAAFMTQRGHLRGSLALSLVVFEKACDMLSLLVWCVFGLLLYPSKDALFWTMTAAVGCGFAGLALLLGSSAFAKWCFSLARRFLPGKAAAKVEGIEESWTEMHAYFWADKFRLAWVTANSIFIWFLHLVQIWMFTLAIRHPAPFLANLALAPLAILAGLLPLTFAGVGTRDAALIFFYAPYMPDAAGAALGVLCTMRYVMPALLGLPFIGNALTDLGGLKGAKALRAKLAAQQ